MSEKVTGACERHSVVAISQSEGGLKGVEIRRKGSATEILWTKASEDGVADWRGFASECGVSSGVGDSGGVDSGKEVVAGFGSAGVVFYRLEVPAAGDAETESIVRMQAESRLPLPADQMELAWRTGVATNGQMSVTMAAARTEYLEEFVARVRGIGPSKIMLDCEAIVKAWRSFFGGDDAAAVIISAGERESHVCLAEGGRLCNAVVLDMGAKDFAEAAATGDGQATERFVQDMKSILGLFGYSDPSGIPLVVLSDGGAATEAMVSVLVAGKLDAKGALADLDQLSASHDFSVERAYEYRVPIGLGLVAIEDGSDELNMFEQLYSATPEEEDKPWFYSVRFVGAIAVAMLVLLGLISYAVDVATPGAIDKAREAALAGQEQSIDEIKERQALRKAIAQQRPDMLELMKLVDEAGQGGIKLDGVSYSKGQLVSVTGEVSSNDQLYKFEEKLNSQAGISGATTASFNRDAKSKKIRFNMTFKYRNFSNRGSRRTR